MLPGIRFIFVTVILSASFLIFGLGAAALLRVSHEEFATLPSWRVAQPQFPPAPVETPSPTLAMLRIETPEAAKPDATEESPDPTPAPSVDADLKMPDTSDKSNVTAETPPQSEAAEAPAERGADIAGQPAPVPAESPAPTAIAAAPMPASEKQENGTADTPDAGSKNSEAVALEVRADQTEATARPDKGEVADVKVAEIKPLESETSESKAPESNVAIAMTTDGHEVSTEGHEVKLLTIKVHATKSSKPVAKKAKRSSIYAMAQRRRAAARARAIARARAARIAQQKLVAMDPIAALFGLPAQPAQLVQTQTPAPE